MIRSFSSTLPIFFVHMPSSEETSGMTEVDRNEFMNHGGLKFTSENELVSKRKEEIQPSDKVKCEMMNQLESLGMF
jgi:hypothetical protein